jgi:hypothetical protein
LLQVAVAVEEIILLELLVDLVAEAEAAELLLLLVAGLVELELQDKDLRVEIV